MEEKTRKSVIDSINFINGYSEADTVRKLLNYKESMDSSFYEIEKKLRQSNWFSNIESAILLKDEIIHLLYQYRAAYTIAIDKKVNNIMDNYKSK